MGGRTEALFLERTHRLTGWNEPRNRKALAGVLVLILGAFVFVGEEARAQQLPPEEARQQSVVVNRHSIAYEVEVVESEFTPTPVREIPPIQSLPEKAVSTPVVRYDLVVSPEPETTAPVSEPTLPANAEPALDPAPKLEPDVDPTPGTASETVPTLPINLEPAPPVVLAPEPASVEDDEPLPPPAGEASAASAVPFTEEEAPQPTNPQTTEEVVLEPAFTGVAETLQSTAADAPGDPASGTVFEAASEDEVLIDTVLVGLSGGENYPVLVVERAGDSDAPSGGTEVPPTSAPRPASPFALPPMGGGSYSLSGGDMGSGGVHLLLLCVLVSGLVLLRRDSELSWGFWEPPKPSSALLRPLERPG